MGIIKSHFADEIEQRAARQDCLNDNEFFESLHEGGVDEIAWDIGLNDSYLAWQYFNIK